MKEDTFERNPALLTVTRRSLIGAGFSGAIVALGMAANPLSAGPSFLKIDFGPQYSVQNVYRVGRATHVELEFRVNARAFRTHLRSADGRTWRPV